MANKEILIDSNSWVKIFLILVSIVSVTITSFGKQSAIIILTLIVLSNKHILKSWFKITIKLIPFLIVYFIMAMLSGIEYLTQLQFGVIFIYFLFISCFILNSFTLKGIIADSVALKKSELFSSTLLFCLTTEKFISQFIKRNTELTKSIRLTQIHKGLELFISSLELTWKEKETIGQSAHEDLAKALDTPSRSFKHFNLMLFLLILFDISVITNFPVNYDTILSTISI